MGKRILHLDMDAFFASVEQAVNPRLKGKPVIVGARHNLRSTVVVAASYEAKAFGIGSGMSLREALRCCPHAVLVCADSEKYVYTSEEIFDILKRYSPRAEIASIDEFYLDLMSDDRSAAERIAAEIKELIRRRFAITGSIGIAPNRIMAKMASQYKKPDGLVILESRDIPAFLKNLSVEKVPGIGPHIGEYLKSMGIVTCGQLANVRKQVLTERYGKIGEWMHDIARGKDVDLVSLFADTAPPPKSVGHSYTVARTIYRTEALKAWIRLLSEMVAARLRRYRLEGKVTYLSIRQDAPAAWFGRQKDFSSHTVYGEEIYRRCLAILTTLNLPRCNVRALGVSVSGLQRAQTNCLFEEDKKKQLITRSVDGINERFGEWTIYPAAVSLTREGPLSSRGPSGVDAGAL